MFRLGSSVVRERIHQSFTALWQPESRPVMQCGRWQLHKGAGPASLLHYLLLYLSKTHHFGRTCTEIRSLVCLKCERLLHELSKHRFLVIYKHCGQKPPCAYPFHKDQATSYILLEKSWLNRLVHSKPKKFINQLPLHVI